MIKIIITGPESTGKSTLAKSLSNYLKEPFVPEFSRYFIPALKESYTAVFCTAIDSLRNKVSL